MERRPPADVLGILRKLHSLGLCRHLDALAGEGDGLCLFDRILKVFREEIDRWESSPPLPASLTDGRPVDLFRLYRAVGGKGGFDSVSSNRWWASVADEIGFTSDVVLSLKSVYFKYLGALNPSLRSVLEEELRLSEAKIQGFDGGGSNSDGDLEILDPEVYNEVFSSLKRKREAPVRMLNWVLSVAKNPGASLEDDGVGDLISQVLTVRKLIFIPIVANDGLRRQKLYEDEDLSALGANTNQRSRCSKRVQSVNSNSHYYSEAMAIPAAEGNPDKQRLRKPKQLVGGAAALPRQKGVPLGPSFQVEMPEWTAMASVTCNDSDSRKWLGTPICPPQRQRSGGVPIGKGREDHCACKCPGSVECYRFHVAEKRLQLKLELGSAFHDWGFDCMGEGAAESWTKDEELRFKHIVRLNPPCLNKNLWNQLYLAFPYKGRPNLVSYYFNVFLLRRRGYQNRVDPDSVDSDDEDRDHGFLSRPIALDAVKDRDCTSSFFSKSEQWVNLTGSSDAD